MPKILLVDDDPVYLDELSEGLQQLGHKVVCAASAREAINSFQSEPIDLVISDVVMSGGGAATLLHELHSLHPDIPFVAITGRLEIASSPLFNSGLTEASAKIEKSASLFEIDTLIRELLK